MSTFMERISQIISLASSSKVTEYKKAIKYLIELWEDGSEEDLQQITDYSCSQNKREDKYSWNDIFIAVHNLFEAEITRINKLSGNSGNLDKEKITKLLYSTSDKASYYLKPKTVVNSTLDILQYNRVKIFAEYYEVYLSILRKYVLQERSQRIFVPYTQWQELLEACTTILNQNVKNVDYVKLLETMDLVVRHGCCLSNLLFETKKLLPIIGNLFENYQLYNIKSTEILFKLCFTVCQQIATDSRYILCAFSESLPLSIIDLKGPEEKYELYLLFTQVHHPNGAVLEDDTSYVCDEGKWKAILNLLYKMVLKEIKLTTLSKNFVALACEVFRQKILTKLPELSTHSSIFQESAYIQPRKKRRLSDEESQDKVIDLVNDRDPERAWPIIQIATRLYRRYPDCLKFDECIEFLNIIAKLMSQCKVFLIMESLCELATVITQNDKIHENDDLKSYWDKIWDAVIRYLSMSHKDTVEKGCILVQNLIYYKRTSSINSILKLFATQSIQRSNHSIRTLEVFCINSVLPKEIPDYDANSTLLTNNSLKLQLLKWSLHSYPRCLAAPLSINNFSKMLIGFTLKSWYKQMKGSFQSDYHDEYFISLDQNFYENMQSVTIDEIERCYLSFNSMTNLPFDQSINNDIEMPDKKNFDDPFILEDYDFLLNNLLHMVQTEGAEKELSTFITKTALIARVITDLKEMNMMQSTLDEFCLFIELKTCLAKIMNHIETINWSKYLKRINYLLEITRALALLYRVKYDIAVNNAIVNSTTLEVIKKIYDIRKIKKNDFESETKLQECKVNAIIILALFCCMDTGEEILDFQIQITSTILKIDKYSLSDRADVISVVTMLQIFSNISIQMITDEFLELLMVFVQEMFAKWHRDDRVNRCLLELVPKFLDKISVAEETEHIHNIFLICKLYHDKFAKGAFGQLTHMSLVQCLNSIINHSTFLHSKESEILNDDTFVTFVKSPYYLVRLESLKYIHSIFSLNKIDRIWKENFLNELKDAINNIFVIQRDLSSEEIQEERLMRSNSVIQILTTLICSKSVFQSSALLMLTEIIVDKSIETGIIKKALIAIDKSGLSSKNIIEDHLNYMLTNWCHNRNLETFPYILLNCLHEAEFKDNYAHVIFPVLIREGKIEDARQLCGQLGASFEQLFKGCCPNIVPWTLSDQSSGILEQLQNNVGNFQEIGSFSVLVRKNVQQVIIEIVKRLRDMNHFYATFKTTTNIPESDPPHYKCDVVNQCFDRLIQILSGDSRRSVFYCIITREPSTIQKILLQLTCNIYANSIMEYRAVALHQYIYFCTKIIVDLRESYCDIVASYFVKDIACTLLHLAKDDNAFIGELACKYLLVFFKDLLPNRSAHIGQILNLCVKTLTPLIRKTNQTSPAKDVLTFLFNDQRECLAEAINNLASLPDFIQSNEDQDFESQVLQESLAHFLKASDDKNCSNDSLLKLKRQLVEKKSELESLYEELESSQGFAEHCASSLLHRLIYRLIRLTKSKDAKIALEAAKCLGVLGPADLSTLILHPQEMQKREVADQIEILTHKISKMLADFVVSADIEMRRVSSDALYILSEYECRENSDALQDFLFPFKDAHKLLISRKKINLRVDLIQLGQAFDRENSMWSYETDPYNIWLSNITSAVANCLTGFYSKSLLPLFKLNVQFCEVALPRLVSIIIDTYPDSAESVCHCINRFFDYHFCHNFNENETPGSISQKMQVGVARDAIRCMLKVVNHLRIQTNEQTDLNFDYLPIAMAAQFCSAYFSSILYAELWCRSNLNIVRDFDSIPIIDQIYEQDTRRGKIIQDILKEAYMKIGDSDSIHGCGSSHLQNRRSRIPYYTNFQKLDKLILSHDIELSVGNSSERGMITALRDSSLYHLANRLLNAEPTQINTMEDLSYDSLWRLSDWNQITNRKASSSTNEMEIFSVFHYEALKCLHENNKSFLNTSLEKAHFCIIKDLNNISLESCKAVYPKLTQLQMLREIEELSSSDPRDYQILFTKWEKDKYICNNNFQYIEPILTQRVVMFQIRESIKSDKVVKNAFINTQLKIARLAQEEGNFNVAARVLETLSKQTDLDEEAENRLIHHEAHLAWLRKDEDMARFNLRILIKKDSIKPCLLAQALCSYGNWIAENKSENPQAIINKYYKKAIDAYSSVGELNSDDVSDHCKARAALAQFAHEQYLMITDYMKSPQFESLMECIDYSHKVNMNKSLDRKDKDINRAFTITDRQRHNDSIEVENIKKDKAMYLSLALENYLLTLQMSDEHDSLIFRLVSLWLSSSNMYDEEINKLLNRQLEKVPSYKFIPLVPQLAPHMSNVEDIFTSKISKVLERSAREHPHHTLPVLLALKNLYNDSKYSNKKNIVQEARVLGAQILVQQLLSSNIRPIVQEMDRLSEALVMLAYYDADKKKAVVPKCSIPRNLLINEIRDFKHSIVPTITIDVKKNGNYPNIVSVRKYESNYDNVGGMNAPKKIICIGTDGIERPQLVKGRDDLRQDAVMQQVFTVMNSLLKNHKDTKQRKLYVRTYKVVPLTQRSGVLEWCNNTLPLSSILTGDGKQSVGLHKKYYPNNYSPVECRKKLQAAKSNQKFNVFMTCCKNLPPAFHHFFTENYLSPETWFERRLAYTRSVATTSIIGYTLGLGDRHVSNILIDKSTAEVIHIDFGIAFEQGKVLPTPETVPFRLTRDMEVGMGVSGVEGTMRRCCEETMAVLREQKEIVVTLLRVLLYDPLYSWAITPAKAATYQSEHSTRSSEGKDNNSPGVAEVNKLAERALLRVQQKLQGIEEGVISSIPGQVERLIQQARDPANLSRLFEGWQAYL